METLYKILTRPVLFRFPSDKIHELTVKYGSTISKNDPLLRVLDSVYNFQHPSLKQDVWGLDFKNPVGLAAGFDKNGTLVHLMEHLGFGFTEVGSITANASTGNPKPRSFRLPADSSIINRMGLNNDGAATVVKRLAKCKSSIPVGVNIAKTHNPEITGTAALDDYLDSYRLAQKVASYITLNISCPNTTEGKTFEDPRSLESLLSHLNIGKDASEPPVLVKLSVDLDNQQLSELLDVCRASAISGYVATNTSARREDLTTSSKTIKRIGKGGLSGKAISDRSTEIIQLISEQTKREKPIIGVGGIFGINDAIEKLKAGADLLQIYTGLVYEGPSLVKKINRGLVRYLEKNGKKHIYQIRS
ncbi:MAG TPA: quinone-dependent dihydroorotate dehydrogenase [Balneolaceae bacterium]|nr:quinone-dependent dihydroorotate dehydrogenase [Balneolaceae bacterium]